jgi:hypothetical protein
MCLRNDGYGQSAGCSTRPCLTGLGRDLASHDVKTARQMGWTTLENGELPALASARFDVFVTLNRN